MPAPYAFGQIFAADPNRTENVAKGGEILIFAPGDAAKAPLVLTGVSGLPLANPVKVNDNGFGPAFMAELDQVAWEGGGFTGTFESYRGMKDEAVAARAASEAAVGSAADSAVAAEASRVAAEEAAGGAADAAVAEVQVQLGAVVAEAEGAKFAAETAAANAAAGASEALAGAVADVDAARVAAETAAGLVGAPAGDAVVAAIQPGGAAHGALSAAIGAQKEAATDGTATAHVMNGSPQTVAVSGHSNFYGQGGDAALPGINGQEGTRRSTNNPPDAMKAALDLMWAGNFTIANNTRSGENSRGLLGAYANPNLGWTHGNIEFVWLDSNDFVAGIPLEENAANIRKLADEIIAEGSQPVFIGSHIMQDRTNTHHRQARAALVRRIAERYGTRYIDIGELQAGFESLNNIWTDGVHMSDAGFAMVGTRLAALMGPKGLNPPRIGPDCRVLPNHQYFRGGTVADRAGATDGRVIRLVAGQTAVMPFEATSPSQAIISFYSSTTDGIGTGRIRYALSKAGIPDRAVNITATKNGTPGMPVAGHTYRGGPDLVFVTCDTGVLEIEHIDFVAPKKNQRPGLPTQPWAVGTALSGIVLMPIAGDPYAKVMDQKTPVSTLSASGANATVRVNYAATFGSGTGTSSQALVLAGGADPQQSWLGFQTGLAIRRGGGGAELVIRGFLPDGSTENHHVDAAFFTNGQSWTGVFSVVITDGSAQVYANGAAIGPAIPLTGRHFTTGAYSGPGPALTIAACTIEAPAGCV